MPFKKIFGMVSDETFEKIKGHGLFNSSWDSWLEEAVLEKLHRDAVRQELGE